MIDPISIRSGGRVFNVAGWAMVLLSFAPYAAIPLGNNTNLPLSAVAALMVLITAKPYRLTVPIPFAVIASGPILASYLILLVRGDSPVLAATATWPLYTLVMSAFSVFATLNRRQLYEALKFSLLFSSSFAIIQKFAFLENGKIPFLDYYDMPGFASVASNQYVIVTYIQRPFGLFPEPSFMAGSLTLATIALALVGRTLAKRKLFQEFVCIALSALAVALSESGSAIVAVGLIMVVAYLPRKGDVRRPLFAALVTGIAVAMAYRVIQVRGTTGNSSWTDRASSILGAFRYLSGDATSMLLGTGRGRGPSIYSVGSLSQSHNSHSMLDIYSVLGRQLLENGILIGTVMLVLELVIIYRGVEHVRGHLAGLSVAFGWLVVGGLTITYDTAAWIWAFPGIAFAIGPSGGRNSSKDGAISPSSAVSV